MTGNMVHCSTCQTRHWFGFDEAGEMAENLSCRKGRDGVDAYNGRVMIRCVRCGQVCPKWEGDYLLDGDGRSGPACPGCHEESKGEAGR